MAVPKPKAGELLAEIESLSHDARGVARVNGKTVFIDGALPGETVRFHPLRRHRRYDTGLTQDVITPSPLRVEPRCPYFKGCGGCSLQHMDAAEQIKEKQKILATQLQRIGRVTPECWLAPLTGPIWHYRRKARLGARYVAKKGGALVGFRERRSSYIADMHSCEILDERAARLLPELRPLVDQLDCRERLPQIEVAAGDEYVALIFRHLEPLTAADKNKLTEFGRRHNIQILLQPEGLDSIHPLWPEAAAPLSYRLKDYDIEIFFGPADFVQINADINEKMIGRAIELLDIRDNDHICDLFCGLGNFSLPLARKAKRVLGLEADSKLVAGAQRNAQHNRLLNADFAVADLYLETDRAPWGDFKFNKALLDPPRNGAIAAIKHFELSQPSHIVYVSCYPATLARDADYLVNHLGYRLVCAGVMDMFPHTAHVESIALFIKNAH